MADLSARRGSAHNNGEDDPSGWQPPKVVVGYADEVSGSGELPNRIARLVSRALRDARKHRDLSRTEVARLLTGGLGRKVTENTLEQWASEASVNHRIPLDAFVALVAATGATDLLGFIPGLFGFVVVPRKYMVVIELQLLEEHERELAAHKARILADLGGER